MSWIQDIFSPETRKWEDFYRNRWQHDRRVRSTHGVNCTGGCSWMVFVKNGIVTWELQATDYPKLKGDVPPYEPRGCQRGISSSWYIYSPIRVKYPYIRGALLDLYREAKEKYGDPVLAWDAVVSNPESRKRYQRARGKGGFRQGTWEESLEIIAASTVHTIKEHGPDRVVGFSPIPAMSMLSYAAGARFLQLMGGVALSFYDWYSDLPNASPETWGEQTDVAESADWYHSKFVACVGSNVTMTRTPDAHFLTESRHNGTKVVVFSPDFSMVSKSADQWLPINAGQDGAFWMAVNHVILKEFFEDKDTPMFTEYIKNFSDTPFLVSLKKTGNEYRAGRFLNASQVDGYKDVENSEWKYLVFDKNTNKIRMPKGSVGHRWQTEKGHWNLEMKDDLDGKEIDPELTFIDSSDDVLDFVTDDFAGDKTVKREIPVKYV